MRIIGGTARGIRLKAPQGQDIRPTEDRVKETLFAVLGDLAGKTVVDAFAGSGSLGLEAISRGAARVIAIERVQKHCDAIRLNHAAVAKAMEATGNQPGAFELVKADAATIDQILKPYWGQVEIVLADPPYNTQKGEFGAAEFLLMPNWDAILASDAILVLEHETRTPLPWSPKSNWKLLKNKTFGIRETSFATFLKTGEDQC